MRKSFVMLAILIAGSFFHSSNASAANPQGMPQHVPQQAAPQAMPMEMSGDCEACCPKRCLGARSSVEGKDLNYNCGCRGSYKFPVPPQYTYHWPGMYSQRLMTDYHSPWRFPPIKPFTEERKQQDSRNQQGTAKLDQTIR